MENKKHLVVLSVIALLCLCLCLSACGKNNKTANVKDKTAISQEQTDDKTKESKPGNNVGDNTAKDSGQKQDQPKIVQGENGSGVEKIDTKTDEQNPSGSTQTTSSKPQPQPTENPTSNPTPATKPGETTEVKPQQGVEPVGESKGTNNNPAAGKETTPAKQLSSSAQEYADYCAMSPDEQYAYYKKFKSADDFMNWYNAAKAAYEKENPATVLEPGAAIDLGGN